MKKIVFIIKMVLMAAMAVVCMTCFWSCASGDEDLPEQEPKPTADVAKHRIVLSMYASKDDIWNVDGWFWGFAPLGAASNPELKLDFPDTGGYAKYLPDHDRDSYERNLPMVRIIGPTSCRVTSVQDCEYMRISVDATSLDYLGDYPSETLWIKLEGYVDGKLTNTLEKEITADYNLHIVFTSVPSEGDRCEVSDRIDISTGK